MIEVKVESRLSKTAKFFCKLLFGFLFAGAWLLASTYWTGLLVFEWTQSEPMTGIMGAIVLIAQIVAGIFAGIRLAEGDFDD